MIVRGVLSAWALERVLWADGLLFTQHGLFHQFGLIAQWESVRLKFPVTAQFRLRLSIGQVFDPPSSHIFLLLHPRFLLAKVEARQGTKITFGKQSQRKVAEFYFPPVQTDVLRARRKVLFLSVAFYAFWVTTAYAGLCGSMALMALVPSPTVRLTL